MFCFVFLPFSHLTADILANDANYKQPKQTTLLITSVSAVRLSGRAYGRKVEQCPTWPGRTADNQLSRPVSDTAPQCRLPANGGRSRRRRVGLFAVPYSSNIILIVEIGQKWVFNQL